MRTPGIWTARFRNHNSRQSQNMQQVAFPRPNRRGPIEAMNRGLGEFLLRLFPRPNRRGPIEAIPEAIPRYPARHISAS